MLHEPNTERIGDMALTPVDTSATRIVTQCPVSSFRNGHTDRVVEFTLVLVSEPLAVANVDGSTKKPPHHAIKTWQ